MHLFSLGQTFTFNSCTRARSDAPAVFGCTTLHVSEPKYFDLQQFEEKEMTSLSPQYK